MRMIARAMILSLVLPILLAGQATLSGKWQGETRNGRQVLLDLAVSGATLTGTLTRDGKPASISDGKASKNTFVFKATLDGMTEAFSGEVGNDQITIWLDRAGASSAVVLKRSK